MNFFSFDLRKALLILGLVVLPLLGVNIQRTSQQGGLLYPFFLVSGWMQMGYTQLSLGVRGTTALYLDLIGIKEQNRVLLQENTELRAQLGSLTELKLENERLNQLLGFQKQTAMKLLAAKVIGKDLLPDHNTITINRGADQGIEQGMAVLTVAGAVGYIYRVQDKLSQVLLLTDRYSTVDVLVQRSRARGLLDGVSKEKCQLRYLRRSDDVLVGDLLVTSGLDNIFPKGFPIGLVVLVDNPEYGVTQKVEVQPVVNPSLLEEVFVVLNAVEETKT